MPLIESSSFTLTAGRISEKVKGVLSNCEISNGPTFSPIIYASVRFTLIYSQGHIWINFIKTASQSWGGTFVKTHFYDNSKDWYGCRYIYHQRSFLCVTVQHCEYNAHIFTLTIMKRLRKKVLIYMGGANNKGEIFQCYFSVWCFSSRKRGRKGGKKRPLR